MRGLHCQSWDSPTEPIRRLLHFQTAGASATMWLMSTGFPRTRCGPNSTPEWRSRAGSVQVQPWFASGAWRHQRLTVEKDNLYTSSKLFDRLSFWNMLRNLCIWLSAAPFKPDISAFFIPKSKMHNPILNNLFRQHETGAFNGFKDSVNCLLGLNEFNLQQRHFIYFLITMT